jgi:hypothetical protein
MLAINSASGYPAGPGYYRLIAHVTPANRAEG